MAEHYHDPSDKQYARRIRHSAPEAFAALQAFDHAALRREGMAIPRKQVELIALAVALTTQCAYCIEAHTAAATAEGASEAELAETILITAALRAGGAVAHGFQLMKHHAREMVV
ncbi:carboxymuconolactone decarboxylase family protein [Microbacterium sp. ASV81]|uniref:Carboxymuconolactone decarboxylase family protein n=1 Tax=Microbacterium capsulatum TaxID=3041921 RepID=A0ABU0XFX9_9MICO|nr:carboxymuconolactone decarboxylase family protein [Microbacterium sp. ASV81]MDQ4214018.1 carboxymuconolactone decarboxylase family protein [Microbacterium sp. ASV81]